VFDVGVGEVLVLLIVGLLLLGPERLPRYAAQAGRLMRQARSLAEGARTQLVDAAGVDPDSLRDLPSLADLHPRRMAAAMLADSEVGDPAPMRPEPAARAVSDTPAPATGAARLDPDAT